MKTFKLARLLYDFGYTPFSHAGEDFYFSNGNERTDELVEVVLDESFKYDVDNLPKTNEAAPHEIMSSLLAIRQFGDFIEDRALFARCITGYRHPNPISAEDYLENILIDTLHSNTIDVDRLDYLIRDAFVVGYDSIVIDFRRLLSSFRVVSQGDKYFRCFYKSALSVLENVVGDFIRAFGERNTFALLNKDTLKKIDEEICSLSDDIEIRDTRQGRERKDALENHVALKSFSDDNGIVFDFSIHNIKSFSSGFSAGDIQAEKIIFIDDSDVDWYDFSDASTNLSAEKEEGKPFFFVSQEG